MNLGVLRLDQTMSILLAMNKQRLRSLLHMSKENVYMRPKVNSNLFEISHRFEMLFRLHDSLHGDFTAATFQTMTRL